MASPSALMSIGARAMMANYAALQTTGHNIANAGVKGYSLQRVELSSSGGNFTGSGFYGNGVDMSTVKRSHDEFLTVQANRTKSISAMDSTRYEFLQEIETAFPVGESGVGQGMGRFLNAMVDVASRPGELASREVVLSRAQDVAARFNSAAQQLDAVQSNVAERLAATVSTINGLADGIAKLNQQIAAVSRQGHEPNDLLDQRGQLISQLSEHVQVMTMGAEDGSTSVFIAGGQRLVLGYEATAMQVVDDPDDSRRSAIAMSETHFMRVLPDLTLGGGKLAGLLRTQNHELTDARTRLGQMASAFAAAVNKQQSFGIDLGNPPSAGPAIFELAGPQTIPNTHNARDGAGNFIAQVSISIDDASQLSASEYALATDPVSGNLQLTRLSDGLVRDVVDGQQIDGFTLNLGPAPLAASDRFLLQPVSMSASSLKVVLQDPRGLAAALPVTAQLATGNTGTAAVAKLRVADNSLDPDQTAAISFTSDSGDYNWELRDRITNAVLSSGTGVWSAGQPIALNGFELTLSGVPRNGDSLSVAKTEFSASNNGNAVAMMALADEAWVGRSVQVDGTIGGGRTFSDAYASAMADMGVQVQGARVASEIAESMAGRAEFNRSAVSGVSLDEEAAKLLAFQQSYQAAAKIIQVAQTVFDTLLSIADR